MGTEQQEPPKLDHAPALQSETDADLLVWMSWRTDDLQMAQAAGSVFYDRHIRYVFGVCDRAARKYFIGNDCTEDLVAETFTRVYERAATFSTAGITDPDQLRRRARAWIGAIARNVVMDALRGRQAAPETHLAAEAWAEQPEREPKGESADAVLVRQAFDEVLDDREREVLRVTFLSYKPGAKQQRLSNADTAALAAAIQTTPDNLRKIRRNAMSKIRDYVMAHKAQANGNHPPDTEVEP